MSNPITQHPEPNGTLGLIVSRYHGLLVALKVSLSSRLFSWSLGGPFPNGFLRSHRLSVSWSFGGSHGLLVLSPFLLVSWWPILPRVLIVSRSHGLLVALMISWYSGCFSCSLGGPFPLGSHGLIVSWSYGLLVALMVYYWSSGRLS